MVIILDGQKVAVSKGEDNNIKVVIHNNPPKNNKYLEDINEYVKKRVIDARAKFSVFNGKVNKNKIFKKKDDDKDYKENCIHIAENIDKYEKDIFITFLVSEDASYEKRIECLKNLFNLDINNEKASKISFIDKKYKNKIKEELVKKAIKIYVESAIRKSLSKYVDIVEDILIAIMYISDKNMYQVKIHSLIEKHKEKMKEFIDNLAEAYYRTEQVKRIVMSLNNQNVKVQSFDNGEGEYELKLSSSKNGKKKALQDTLEKCAINSKDTFAMLKKLIILYVYGKDICEKVLINKEKWGGLESVENIDKVIAKGISFIDTSKIKDIIDNSDKNNKKALVNANNKIKTNIEKQINSKCHSALNELKLIKNGEQNSVYSMEEYWIRHFNSVVRKQLVCNKRKRFRINKDDKKNNDLDSYLFFKCDYLFKMLWKETYKFLSNKFMDIGKIVYHCAMPDEKLSKKINGEVEFGNVLDEYRYGITSFDYERIATTDDFDRKREMYISFAINNFASSIVKNENRIEDKHEDVMLYNKNDFSSNKSENASRDMMRFFGGYSEWQVAINNFTNEIYSDNGDNSTEISMISSIKEAIYKIRNESFHYITMDKTLGDKDIALYKEFFKEEYNKYNKLIKSKWYSNNVLMWYKMDIVNDLMKNIYRNKKYDECGMPSYRKIVFDKELRRIINDEFKIDIKKYISDNLKKNEYEKMYISSMDYILKQLYYYVFLNDEKILEKFIYLIETDNNNKSNLENEDAFDTFYERIKNIREYNNDIAFNEICHIIMSDYNQANNQIQMVKDNTNDNRKRKHFPILLYGYIRKMFIDYLRKEKVNGLTYKAIFRDKIDVSNIEDYEKLENPFLESSSENMCFLKTDDIDKMSEYILSWYIMAHFLPSTYLNHLIGAFNDYIVRINDINKREEYAGVNINSRLEEKFINEKDKVDSIVSVLTFVLEFSGQTTKEVTDYFDDYEDYAKELSKYIDFEMIDNSYEKGLKKICRQEYKNADNGVIGIYFDGENPIVNRNVVLSNMYCNTDILTNALENRKISIDEIKEYYDHKHKLAQVDYRTKEGIFMEEHLDIYTKFVQLKNRIELVDVRVNSELLNELYSHLISWAYLRERDEMYYLLGYYYLNIKNVSEDSPMRKIARNDRDVNFIINDGAILRQIVAIYAHGVNEIKMVNGVYKFEDYKIKKRESFLNLYGEEQYKEVYNLFEDYNKKDDIVNLRNYVDHFKYFVKCDKSMIDLYQDYYDDFLRYSDKYRKNVIKMLKNHLYRKKIEAEPEIDFTQGNGIRIILNKDKNCKSVKFTYRVLKKKDTKDNKKNKNNHNKKGNKNYKSNMQEDGEMFQAISQLNIECQIEYEETTKELYSKSKEYVNDVFDLLNYKKRPN